ncbi:hypothetical protein Tco_0178287 [Tanacetum coccineum]
MSTVHFGNDNFTAITGYGDYIHGNITICHVYYVEGLGHNLFSVGQFCDGDLEVSFCSNTCYVRNMQGDNLLIGGRDSNLYISEGSVNSGSVEKDTHVPDLCAIEKLARNAYQEAKKQQIFAQQVQKQNTHLTSQLEMYKERVRILESINKDNNYLNEFLEADERAKRYNKQAQSQLAKLKKNVDLILKLGNSLQGMFMLGPKPLSVYDQQLKHGLGYPNPYTLKQAISKCPKLYVASSLGNLEIPLNVRDSEDTLEDAFKSQQKMNEKMNDLIVVANKQNCWTTNYKQLNALYADFVPQKELSVEQKYFPSSSIPSVKILNCKRASIFYTSPAEIQINDFCQDQVKPILNELKVYLEFFQNLFQRDIKEMKDVFESTESELNELEKQNELLKDQLLEASLAEDIKNLVITSCVEIRNKDLHDEIDRISKESKDVSNESKTADTVCNDAFEVTQGLSKRIVELEKDLSKFEAKSIAFEIALQHKSRENNSLKTVQKENENFMASLQLENAHLKQTYKDLFESVQRSKVETNQCDEVKVKDNFDEIETKNIELEYRVASLIKENEHLKLTYKNLFDSIKKSRVQTKTSNVTQNEAENLKSQLFEFAETKFSNILEKIEFFKKSPGEKQHLFENKTSVFQIKIDELEKVLTQQTKDFNAVKLELSNRTAKFEAYFEKLEKTKVVLERQLARKVDDSKAEKDQFLKEINHLRTQLENLKGKSVKTKFDKHSILGKPPADKLLINSQISKSWFTPKVDMQKSLSKPVTAQSLPKNEKDQLLKRIAYLESKLASQDIRSCQKEYHELRTLYNALKVKFDSLNRKRRETNVSKSSKPRESVSAKVHTGESSKPFSRRVSQFTTYSLQKDRKFSKNSQSFETLTPQKGFKKRASNAKHQSFETIFLVLRR